MPRRTNTFQEVVAIIRRHLAGDAVVEESAMLTHRVTGKQREVDVVIRAGVAGEEMTLSVEATAEKRPVDVGWVERLVAKHENLPTNKLVLVSESGFTAQARDYAEFKGAVPLSARDLSGADPAFQVVNRLSSLWPKSIAMTPDCFEVQVRRDEGAPVWVQAGPDSILFLPDGRGVDTLLEGWHGLVKAGLPKVLEQIGMADISESMDRYFVLEVGPPSFAVDGVEQTLCLQFEDVPGHPEFCPIDTLRAKGKAVIKVSKVELEHRRLGETALSYGEGDVAGHPALLVVSEDDAGGQLTVRFRGASGEGTPADTDQPPPES